MGSCEFAECPSHEAKSNNTLLPTSFPGAVVLLSISTGPLGMSTSNKWTLRYLDTSSPSELMITWVLYLSGGVTFSDTVA